MQMVSYDEFRKHNFPEIVIFFKFNNFQINFLNLEIGSVVFETSSKTGHNVGKSLNYL
jgi:hypothetical protein